MQTLKNNKLAKVYALCEWPCVVGVVSAILMLIWQSAATPSVTPPAAPASLYSQQRSLHEVDSNCRQELHPLKKEVCTHNCGTGSLNEAAALEEPDFGWSILTCTEAGRYHGDAGTGGTMQNLVIEVIRTERSF